MAKRTKTELGQTTKKRPRRSVAKPPQKSKTPKGYKAPRAVTGGRDVERTTKQVKRVKKGKAPLAKMPEPTKKYRQYRRVSREEGKGKAQTLAKSDLFGKGYKKRAAFLGLKEPDDKTERKLAAEGRKTSNILDIKPREDADTLLSFQGTKPSKLRNIRIDELQKDVRSYKQGPEPKKRVKRLQQESAKQYSRKELLRLRKQKGKPVDEELAKAREQSQRAQRELGEIEEKRETLREARKPGRQVEGEGDILFSGKGGVEALREKGIGVRGVRKERETFQGRGMKPLGTVALTKGKGPLVRIPGTKKRVSIKEPAYGSTGEAAIRSAELASLIAPIPAAKGAQLALRGARALKAVRAVEKAAKGAGRGVRKVIPKRAPKPPKAKPAAKGKGPKEAPKPQPKKPTGQRPQRKPSAAKPKAPAPKPAPRPKPQPVAASAKEQVKARFQSYVAKRAAKPSTKLRDIGRPGAASIAHPAVVFKAAKGSVGARFGPAAIEGHAEAIREDPEKVMQTTLRMLPGLVAAPVGIVTNVLALPAYRAATALTNIREYSGAEITAPMEGELDAQVAFLKEFGGTMASGDPERIKEAVINDYGLLAPLMLGISGGKHVRAGYRKVVKEPLRVRVEVKRVEKGKRTPPRGEITELPPVTAIGRATERAPVVGLQARRARGRRKEEAVGKARAERRADIETKAAATPIVKALRKAVRGERKRGRTGLPGFRRDPEPIVADALKLVAEEGAATGARGLEVVAKVRGRIPDRDPDLDPNTIALHDVLDYIEANPKVLDNPHFREAVAAYKAQAEDVTLSVVARQGSQARTAGVPLPHEQIPVAARGVMRTEAKPHVKATDAIKVELKQDRTRLGKLNREAARKRGQARTARAEAKRNRRYGDARMAQRADAKADRLTKESRQLRDEAARLDEQMDVKRAALREPLGARVEEFETRMAEVRKREGLEEPAYTSDVRVGEPEALPAPPPPPRGSKKVHKTDKVLHDLGTADPTFGTLYRSSIAGPRVRRAFNQNMQRFVAHAIPYERGGKFYDVVSRNELRKPEIAKQYDMDNIVLVPVQQVKAALEEGSVGAVEGIIEAYNAVLGGKGLRGKGRTKGGAMEILRELESRGGPFDKGTKYMAFDRARAQEHFAQMEKAPWQGLASAQRFASRAILGYSPSWLMLQPIAEGAQGLAAVGPRHMLMGQAAWRKMNDEQRTAVQVIAGETPGAAVTFKDISGLRNETNALTDTAMTTLSQTPVGWAFRNLRPDELFSYVDRFKGGRIRRVVAMGALHREMKGFLRGQQGFLKGMGDISKELRGKPLADQAGYMARHPEIAARMEKYLDDVMGNWTALTRRERYIAPMVIFYPFVRMSIRWALWSYPKNHPVKANVMYFLAQQNANQLESLLGGPPGFWRQWGTVPIYAGRGDQLGAPTSLLDLSRIAPAGNTIAEAIGNADQGKMLTDLARALNPIVGAGLAGWSGADPLSGRSLVERGEVVSDELRVRTALAQLLSMPAPLRAGLARLGLQRKVSGKPQTPTSELFEKISGITPGEKMVRAFLPPLPRKTATERKTQYLSRALRDLYGAPELKGVPKGAPRKVRRQAAKGLARSYVGQQRVDALMREYGVGEYAPEGQEEMRWYSRKLQLPKSVEEQPMPMRRLVKKYGGRAFLPKKVKRTQGEHADFFRK